MAAPIVHIVLSKKVFEKYFSGKDIAAFIVGTSFPDIRRFGKLTREATHLGEVTLEEIQEEDSFMAGVKFHQLVDHKFDEFAEKTNFWSLFPEAELMSEGAKVFMDRVLYEKVSNWEEIIGYFDKVYQEELNFGVTEETARKWHKKVTGYLSQKPMKTEEIDSMITDPIDVSREIGRIADAVNDAEKATRLAEEFYEWFLK